MKHINEAIKFVHRFFNMRPCCIHAKNGLRKSTMVTSGRTTSSSIKKYHFSSITQNHDKFFYFNGGKYNINKSNRLKNYHAVTTCNKTMLPCRLFSDKKKYTGFEEFVPTTEWQTVKDGQILPPGLEINVNVTTGEKQAKLKVEEEVTTSSTSTTPSKSTEQDANSGDSPPPPPPPRKKKKGKRVGGMSKEEMERRLYEAKAPSRRQETNKQIRESKLKGEPLPPPIKSRRKTSSPNASKYKTSLGGKSRDKDSSASSKGGEKAEHGSSNVELNGTSTSSSNVVNIVMALGVLLVGSYSYQKYVNKDDDPIDTWINTIRALKEEYFDNRGNGKADDVADVNGDDAPDEGRIFETLEEYEAYKKKKNQNIFSDSRIKKGSEKKEDPNRKLSMAERLKQYEEGNVDILTPVKTKGVSATETIDNANNNEDNENIIDEPLINKLHDEKEEAVKEEEDEMEKPLEKPQWMKERDEKRSKRWFKNKRQRDEEAWEEEIEQEITTGKALQALDEKDTIRRGLEGMLRRKRAEEARYRQSIGLRPHSTIFKRKEKYGRTEEENIWLEKFRKEKEEIKNNLKNL